MNIFLKNNQTYHNFSRKHYRRFTFYNDFEVSIKTIIEDGLSITIFRQLIDYLL